MWAEYVCGGHVIGIVGPRDSVRLVTAVAERESVQVVGRSYKQIGDATEQARSLDPLVNIIVFTGRIPYLLALREGGFHALLDFVPHTGMDLYPTLVTLLQENKGRLPTLSIDTVERNAVEEVFHEIGQPPPEHVIAIDDETEDIVRAGDPAHLTSAHQELHASGAVQVCLTCIESVHRKLSREGIPSHRITHRQATIRATLRHAGLASRLVLSEGNQIALVRVEIRQEGPPAAQDPKRAMQRATSELREQLETYAQRLQGTLVQTTSRLFTIHTIRGVIEDAIARMASGYSSALDFSDLRYPVNVAVGVGGTVAGAEEHARRALELSRRSGKVQIIFNDGSSLAPEEEPHLRTVRSLSSGNLLVLSAKLGLGPLALTRLIEALRKVDCSFLTARELAEVYGIKPRSARRLLYALRDSGFAVQLGKKMNNGAGRPEIGYRVDVGSLLQEVDS